MSNLICGVVGIVGLVAIYGVVFYFIYEICRTENSNNCVTKVRDYYADYHKTIDKKRDVEIMVKGRGAGDIHHIEIYYNDDIKQNGLRN